jgi:lipopolysaccharide exporter
MGFRNKALGGFGWHSGVKVLTAGVTAGKLFILARLLTPAEFGLFSLTAIALGITEAATETGINVFLIQTKKSIEYFLDTAWVIALTRGLAIGCLMLLLGLGMSRWYQQSDLLYLVGLAAIVPIIKGAINPAIISWRKNLQFGAESMVTFTLMVFEAALGIGLAWLFHSVWVLLAAMIGSAILEVILSWWLLPMRPKWQYFPSRAQEIFAHSKWLNGTSVLGYLHENLDNIIIGKLASVTHLGFYQNSYALGHKLNYELAQSVHHSTFPILTQLSNHQARLRRAFWQSRIVALLGISVTSLPLLIFPELAVVLLGEQWLDVVPLVRPLVLAGWIQGFSLLFYTWLYVAKKYQNINLHLGVSVVSMAIGLLLAVPNYGLSGGAWSIVLTRLLSLPLVLLPIWQLTTKK